MTSAITLATPDAAASQCGCVCVQKCGPARGMADTCATVASATASDYTEHLICAICLELPESTVNQVAVCAAAASHTRNPSTSRSHTQPPIPPGDVDTHPLRVAVHKRAHHMCSVPARPHGKRTRRGFAHLPHVPRIIRPETNSQPGGGDAHRRLQRAMRGVRHVHDAQVARRTPPAMRRGHSAVPVRLRRVHDSTATERPRASHAHKSGRTRRVAGHRAS